MLKKKIFLPLLTLFLFFIMGTGVFAAEEDLYFYDETPAEKVTVRTTLSYDGIPLVATDEETELANLEVEVPYFDLALYGLEKYYRYPTDDAKDYKTEEPVVKRPTGLHLYIYLIEKYYLDLPDNICGSGAAKDVVFGNAANKVTEVKNIFGETAYEVANRAPLALAEQPACSLFMDNFWGYGSNLNYYVNHIWPLWKDGGSFGGASLWRTGATIDYILLEDGDIVELAMFGSNDFINSSSKGFAYFKQLEYTIREGESLAMDHVYRAVEGDYCMTDQLEEAATKYECFVMDSNRNMTYADAADNGESVIYSFSGPGVYDIYALESTKGVASCDPAVARVTVLEDPEGEVKEVVNLIASLGTAEYTSEYKVKLDAAKAAYEALSDEEKALILDSEVAAMEAAQSDYDTLEKEAIAKAEEEKKKAEEAKKKAEEEAKKKAEEEAKKAAEKAAAIKAVQESKIVSLKAAKYKTTGLKLSWSKNSKVDGYEVWRSTKANSKYSRVKTITKNSTKTYTLKKGLKKSTTYYYRVRGYKVIDGEKVYTPYTRIIVNLNKTKAVKAISLSGVKATVSKGKVVLTWNKHESMYSLKGYKIYKSTKKNSGYKLAATVKKEKATIKKGLKKGKTYYLKIQGYVKVGKKTITTKAKIVKVKAK